MNQRDDSRLAVSAAVFAAEKASPAVLTVSEAAAFLRVSPDSVLRHRRELGGFRIGRVVRFRRDRLEAFTMPQDAPAAASVAPGRRQAVPLLPAERRAWRKHLRQAAKAEA